MIQVFQCVYHLSHKPHNLPLHQPVGKREIPDYFKILSSLRIKGGRGAVRWSAGVKSYQRAVGWSCAYPGFLTPVGRVGVCFPFSRPGTDPSVAVVLVKPAAGCCPLPRGAGITVLALTRCMSHRTLCSSVPHSSDFSWWTSSSSVLCCQDGPQQFIINTGTLFTHLAKGCCIVGCSPILRKEELL